MRWPAAIWTNWRGNMHDDTPGTDNHCLEAWGKSGRAATPKYWRRWPATDMGALSNAEGCWHLEQAVMRGAPWRLAMRVFSSNMPPLQQAWFP